MKLKHKRGPLSATGILFFFLAAWVLDAGVSSQSFAQVGGGVSITPKAVLFEGRKRTAEVTLINKSNQATTYRIYFKNMRMKENGSLEKIEKPGPDDPIVDKFIRYSPRQVTIPGGGSQSVRLALRKPSKLPAGEYRSHLVFKALPPPDTGADIEAEGTQPGEIRIKMVTVISLSIPVVMRHGDTQFTAQLSDLTLKPGNDTQSPPQLKLKIHRKGNRSATGNLIVMYRPPGGSELEIGRINGLSVYSPLPARTARVRLNLPDGVVLKGGELHVTYRDRSKENKGAVLAEAKLAVP